MTDVILIDPTLGEVNRVLDEGATLANKRQRIRQATLQVTPEVWDGAPRVICAGGTPAPIGGGSRGTTTVLGVAWVLVDGVRYVRVVVGRVKAPCGGARVSAFGSFNGLRIVLDGLARHTSSKAKTAFSRAHEKLSELAAASGV